MNNQKEKKIIASCNVLFKEQLDAVDANEQPSTSSSGEEITHYESVPRVALALKEEKASSSNDEETIH